MIAHHPSETHRLAREISALDRRLEALPAATVGLRNRSRAGFLRALRDYKAERMDHLGAARR